MVKNISRLESSRASTLSKLLVIRFSVMYKSSNALEYEYALMQVLRFQHINTPRWTIMSGDDCS